MFEYLRGRVLAKTPSGIVLDVQGVGYGLTMPLRALMRVPRIGEECEIWVHTRVREDSITLFGFMSAEDRTGFEFLMQVSGVGPKAALAVFSAMSYEDFVDVLRFKQIERLQAVPGLGKKTAEKIVFELESKADRLMAASVGVNRLGKVKAMGSLGLEAATQSLERSVLSDLRSALENLGYKDKEIKPILEKMRASAKLEEDFSDLLKDALKNLASSQDHRKGASLSFP